MAQLLSADKLFDNLYHSLGLHLVTNCLVSEWLLYGSLIAYWTMFIDSVKFRDLLFISVTFIKRLKNVKCV